MLNLTQDVQRIRNLLDELSLSKDNMKAVASELESLDMKYQAGEYNYREYITLKNKLLKNRTWEQVWSAYINYTVSLISQIRKLNSGIAKKVYLDKSYEHLSKRSASKKKPIVHLPDLESLDIGGFEREKIVPEVLIPRKAPRREISETEPLNAEIPAKIQTKKKHPELPELEVPTPEQLEYLSIPKPTRIGFFNRLLYAFTAKDKPWIGKNEDVFLDGFFSRAFIDYLFRGKDKRKDLFEARTTIMPSILSFEDKARIDQQLGIGKVDILDPYLLEKQIKELKSLISKKKPDVYKASLLGYLANITVRKLSIYFIEKYPVFFKKLYVAVRNADLKILANTYINIIFFLTIVIGIFSLPVFSVIYAYQGDPLGIVFLKVLGSVAASVVVTFFIGYYYPFMKAKSRKRSINTNLSFAIDHMSSVIASGVSPSVMFKLISNSKEYGEISVEIEKVTNYIDFFGYDILTSLRAVALTTPSEDFKEFIDGFVSTIETGGDLKNYLSQKSSEALLNYRLERQKYVESLSTYSDIYTGVLIAAPLFFVTVLSLVSALGGTIGGIRVSVLMSAGTYLVIPALNMLFLFFLEINQPDI